MDQADIPAPTRPLRVPVPSEEEARRFFAELRANSRRRALSGQALLDVIDKLPKIGEEKLKELGEQDSSCPICFNTFLAIIAEEEMALAMDSAVYSIEDLGVTKLDQAWQCGHMFCRRDITKWIQQGQRACPMCRRMLAKPIPGEPEEAGEALMSFGIPIDIAELITPTRHLRNADFTIEPVINDPNVLAERRRRFLEDYPRIPAQTLAGISPNLAISPEQQNELLQDYPPSVPEDSEEPPPSGMYS